MKKLFCTFLTCLMVVSLTACGSQTKTVVLSMEENGVVTEMKLEAEGDAITKITQTSTIDCSGYSDDNIALIKSYGEQYKTTYEQIEGITYSMKESGTDLIEEIVVDATNADTLDQLSSSGLFEIEGSSSTLSLEKTVENLKSLGMSEK